LELVIDEHGNVESVGMRQSISPLYDPDLLAAARRWRFTPATKDGKAVKYVKLIQFVLSPPSDD
jgi:TonB family protein